MSAGCQEPLAELNAFFLIDILPILTEIEFQYLRVDIFKATTDIQGKRLPRQC